MTNTTNSDNSGCAIFLIIAVLLGILTCLQAIHRQIKLSNDMQFCMWVSDHGVELPEYCTPTTRNTP